MTREKHIMGSIARLLFFCVLMGSVTTTLAASFSDVPDTHPQAKAIESLKAANVISGFPDGTFLPDGPVSRAQAVAIVIRSLGLNVQKTSSKLPFSDVSEDAWYYPHLQKAVALGRVHGYSDGTFKPDAPVILPEAVTMMLNFYAVSTKQLAVDPVIYGGIANDQWFSHDLQYAKYMNLIWPDSSGNVNLNASLTRAKFAELVFRMRTIKQTGKPIDITDGWVITTHEDNNWIVRNPTDWGFFKGKFNSVLWKAVKQQPFFTRVWPSSVQLSISQVENTDNLSTSGYFTAVENHYRQAYPNSKPKFTPLTLNSKSAYRVEIVDQGIIDQYIALPSGKFLVMYGQYGSAPIGQWYKKQLELVLDSYQYIPTPIVPVEPVIPLEERLQTLREQILIEGGWNTTKNLFKDKKLISTDAIGVGTGPVDYYFSAEANYSIKVERNAATVLNIREGQTTAF